MQYTIRKLYSTECNGTLQSVWMERIIKPSAPSDLQVLDVGNIYDFHSALTESKWNLVGYEIIKLG